MTTNSALFLPYTGCLFVWPRWSQTQPKTDEQRISLKPEEAQNGSAGGMVVSTVPAVEGSMPEDGLKNIRMATINSKLQYFGKFL